MSASDAVPGEGRPIRRRAVRIALVASSLLLGLIAAFLIGLQFDAIGTRAARLVARAVVPSEIGVSIGRVSGSWIRSIRIIDLRLTGAAGDTVVSLDTLEASYRLLPLFGRRVDVRALRVSGPVIRLARRPDGSTGLQDWPASPAPAPADTSSRPWRIDVADVRVTGASGRLSSPVDSTNADIAGSDAATFVWTAVDLAASGLSTAGPSLSLDSASGSVDVPGLPDDAAIGPLRFAASATLADRRLRVSSLDIDGPDSRVSAGGVLSLPDSAGGETGVDFEVDVDSFPLAVLHALLGNRPDPDSRLSARLDLGGSSGTLTADIRANTTDGGHIDGSAAFSPSMGPVHYRADLTVAGIDPAFFTGDTALAGRIDGVLAVDLEGPERASLSGNADASFQRFGVGPASLRDVRLVSAWDAGAAAVELNATGDDFSGRLEGRVRPLDTRPQYDLTGRFAARIPGDTADLASFDGTLDLSGSGIAPDGIRADAAIALARVTLMSARPGTGRITANVDSGRVAWTLHLDDIASGSVAANGSVSLGAPTAFRIDRGSIRELDIAAILGDSLPSLLDASFSASGALGSPGTTRSDLRIAVRNGRYGALVIDTTVIDASLGDGRLAAEGRARSNAGRIDFVLGARPFAEVPEWTVDRLTFSHVDAGATRPDSAFSTDLSGSARGTGRGASLDGLELDFRVTLDSSRINRQSVPGGTARVGLRAGRSDLSARLALADSGTFDLEITGRPFVDQPSFEIGRAEFHSLDPFAIGGIAGRTASITGRLAGSIEGLDPATMVSTGELRLDASRIGSQPIAGGHARWDLRGAALTADTDVDLGDGRVTADATVGFADPEPEYEIRGSLRSDRPGRLAGIDTLAGSVDATFSVEGRGTRPASMNTRVRATADGASLGELQVDTLRLALLVEDGIATFDTLTIRSNLADVSGSGSVPVSDSVQAALADLEIRADIKALDPVRPWLAVDPVGLGSAAIRIAIAGPTDSMRLDASATASAVLLGRTRIIGFESTVGGRLSGGLELQSATGTAQFDRLSIGGQDVRLSRLDGEYADRQLTLEGNATVDDRRDVAFETRVDLRPDTSRAELRRLDVRVDQDQWRLANNAWISWARGIRFDSVSLRAGDQSLSLDGTLDLANDSDLSGRITQLRIAGIADLIGYPDLSGALTSSFDLRGPAADPRITAGVEARLQWRNGQSSAVAASITYDTLRLDVDGRVSTDADGTLTIQGGIPVDLSLEPTVEGDTARRVAAASGQVDLTLRADSFAVQWIEPFLPPDVARRMAGRLQIDAHVGGTNARPVLSGFVRLADGRLTVPRLGVTYEDAAMRVTLDDSVARIDSARAVAGGGTITLAGTVSLPELSLGEFDIEASLDRFRTIYNDAYRVNASGTVTLSGTTKEPRLTGNVQLRETDIYLGSRATGASVRPVELTDEQIRELEQYLGIPVRPPARDPSALYDAMAIDLTVSMSRDTWVRQRANPTLEIQLTGDVEITKQPADSLQLDGRVEAISQRSYVEQFGKRFRIDEGVVELQGPPSEARIDIRAVYRVPSVGNPNEAEVTITLDINGTLNDLSLTLGSEPQLENADIISYLATGRPAASSLDFSGSNGGGGGGGGGIGTIGSQFALGQVTSLVEGLATERIGLDVIEIRPDGLRGATLIAGRYVSPSLFVGFKQPIGRNPEATRSSSEVEKTQVQLEYQALRWLLLNMEASNSAVTFLFRYRRAY